MTRTTREQARAVHDVWSNLVTNAECFDRQAAEIDKLIDSALAEQRERHPFYANDPGDFAECAECAAKPGMPVLCGSCLRNRSMIEELRRRLVEAESRHAAELAKAHEDYRMNCHPKFCDHCNELKDAHAADKQKAVDANDAMWKVHYERAAKEAERQQTEAVKEALREERASNGYANTKALSLIDETNKQCGAANKQRDEVQAALAAERLRADDRGRQIEKLQNDLSKERHRAFDALAMERRNWEAYREGEAERMAKAAAEEREAIIDQAGWVFVDYNTRAVFKAWLRARRGGPDHPEWKAHGNVHLLTSEDYEALKNSPREGEKGRIEQAVAAVEEKHLFALDRERERQRERIEAAVREEREACAKILDNGSFLHDQAPTAIWARQVAALIRQRAKASPTDSRSPKAESIVAKSPCVNQLHERECGK